MCYTHFCIRKSFLFSQLSPSIILLFLHSPTICFLIRFSFENYDALRIFFFKCSSFLSQLIVHWTVFLHLFLLEKSQQKFFYIIFISLLTLIVVITFFQSSLYNIFLKFFNIMAWCHLYKIFITGYYFKII